MGASGDGELASSLLREVRARRFRTWSSQRERVLKRLFMRSAEEACYRTVALYPTCGGLTKGRIANTEYGFDELLDA